MYETPKYERMFTAAMSAHSFAQAYIRFGWRTATREYFTRAMLDNIDMNIYEISDKERRAIIEKVMSNLTDDAFRSDG